MNILFKNIKIVSPEDGINTKTDLLIVNGIIEKIGKVKEIPKDIEIVEAGNLTCVPGFFDMHVHFRIPGQEHKEDLETGSNAAMSGGFTGVLCMPNTNPPLDNPKLIKQLRKKSEDSLLDVEYTACISKHRQGQELADIPALHKAGAKWFTDDGSPVENPQLMRRAFEETAKLGSIIIQHAEDMQLSNHGVINEGRVSRKLGLKGIPSISETVIIARDVEICKFVKNARYHVQHVSCADSVDMIRNAKWKGINATTEVCPHHFILTDNSLMKYGTNAKMNPPLRTKNDVEAILEGLRDGTIDVICTDHAPHSAKEKAMGLNKAPFGIVGLETCIGLTYTYLVQKKIISFKEMIYRLSINPRKIMKLNPIKMQEGVKANLTILDTNRKWKIDKSKFLSKSKNTPFDGFNVTCRPFCVINNNKITYSSL
ncbi:MAG TPA: dihydroorotase [Ignavibacteria bacterium]|nr:dihydroorotase [Ignavibacteria bacterium]